MRRRDGGSDRRSGGRVEESRFGTQPRDSGERRAVELLHAGGTGLRGEVLDGSGEDRGQYRDERVGMDGWGEGKVSAVD